MNSTIETILLYTIGAGLLSIVYGYLTGKNILNSSAGNSKMQDIASAIQIGAKAIIFPLCTSPSRISTFISSLWRDLWSYVYL